MIPAEFSTLVSDLTSNASGPAGSASGPAGQVTHASHGHEPNTVIQRAVACGLADVDGGCVRLTSIGWRVTCALARQQRTALTDARAVGDDSPSELWEHQIAAQVEAVLTELCRYASPTRCPITGCDLADAADIPLDRADPGVVGHLQSPELNRALDTDEREHLLRVGLIGGLRIVVHARNDHGTVIVRTGRGLVEVSAPLSQKLRLRPGDLAELTDQITRRRR